MNKLITSALIASVLLTGGFQTVANARSTHHDISGGDRTPKSRGSDNDREYVCKYVLQRNCT